MTKTEIAREFQKAGDVSNTGLHEPQNQGADMWITVIEGIYTIMISDSEPSFIIRDGMVDLVILNCQLLEAPAPLRRDYDEYAYESPVTPIGLTAYQYFTVDRTEELSRCPVLPRYHMRLEGHMQWTYFEIPAHTPET